MSNSPTIQKRSICVFTLLAAVMLYTVAVLISETTSNTTLSLTVGLVATFFLIAALKLLRK